MVARSVSSVGHHRRHSVASPIPEVNSPKTDPQESKKMPINVYEVNAGRGAKKVTEMWGGRYEQPVANWIISKLPFISCYYEASIVLIYQLKFDPIFSF